MRKVVFVPGLHKSIESIPTPIVVWRRRELWLEASLDWRATYEIEGQDQMDWNKLGGVAAVWGSWRHGGMVNKAMAAWRWVPGERMFHFGIMWHGADGARSLPESNGTIVKVAPGHSVRFAFYMGLGDAISARVEAPGNAKDVVCEGTLVRRLMRSVTPYFGGNRRPPRRLVLFLKKWKR